MTDLNEVKAEAEVKAKFDGSKLVKAHEYYDRLLQGILDIGEEMVVAGAEVSRVEDSINRMCEAYDAERINVFIITSNIQVTIQAPDGRILTHIRRILRYDVNFDRLDYLNSICRTICAERPNADELHDMLEEVLNRPKQPFAVRAAGCMLASGGFAMFFGGNLMDGIAAAVLGLIMTLIELVLAKREKNQIVYNFIVSVAAGICAHLMVGIGFGDHADMLMIGGIMLLIPGIAMTNAIRDMLIGDIASGMLRLSNALLVATAIAGGFAFTIIVLGGVL